jgi:hypothetical protein
MTKSNTFHGSEKKFQGLFPLETIFNPISRTKHEIINLSRRASKNLCFEAISGYVSMPIRIAENKMRRKMKTLNVLFFVIF